MTAFANTSFDTAPIFTVPKNPLATRWAVDEAVRENRKNTPPEVVEQRKEPRYSIEEINRLDIDTLTKRFANKRSDRRPSVVKALDMIDLPRNSIANILFGKPTVKGVAGGIGGTALAGAGFGALVGGPAGAIAGGLIGGGIAAGGSALAGIGGAFISDETRSRITDGNEHGSFDLPRVNFSDALKELGVENKVARAIVGFAGDVALDPLTYLGGTGAGMRLVTATGKGAGYTLSKTGRKVLIGNIEGVAKSGGIHGATDDAAKELFKALGVSDSKISQFAQEAAQEVAGTKTPVWKAVDGKIRGLVLGDIQRPRVQGALRPLGFDTRVGSSPIADAAHRAVSTTSSADDIAKSQAALGFLTKYQRGSTHLPGFSTAAARAAESGSEIAHLPFTDKAIRVKAFTQEGRERAVTALKLRAGLAAPHMDRASTMAVRAVRGTEAPLAESEQILSSMQEARQTGQARVVAVPDVDEYGNLGDIRFELSGGVDADELALDVARLGDLKTEANNAAAELIKAITTGVDAIPTDKLTPGVLVATAKVMDDARTKAKIVSDRAELALKEYQHINGYMKAAREDLRKVAASLVNDGEPWDDAKTTALNRAWSDMQASLSKTLAEELPFIPDNELAAMGTRVEVAKSAVTSLVGLEIASGNTLRAAKTSEEMQTLELAKHLLGTTSDLQGAQILGPLRQYMLGKYSEDEKVLKVLHKIDDAIAGAERAVRGVFPQRKNQLHELSRKKRTLMGPATRALEDYHKTQLFKQVSDAIVGHKGVTLDQADSMVSAIQMRILGERFPLDGHFLYKFDPNAKGGIAVGKDGLPIPMEWNRVLTEAMQGGILSEKANPGLAAKLEALANDRIARYLELAASGEEDFRLVARTVYLPNTITDDLAEQIRIKAASGFRHGAQAAPSKKAAHTTLEALQKRSNQIEYRFPAVGKDGKESWHQFYEWQKQLYGNPEFDTRALIEVFGEGSPVVAQIERVKESIRAWDELPMPMRDQHRPRPADPFDLNQRIKDGEFAFLTNGRELNRGGFEVSSSMQLARNIGQHQRASTREAYAEIMADHAWLVPSEVWANTLGKTGEVNIGGVIGRLIPGKKTGDLPVLVVGSERYRPMNMNKVTGVGEELMNGAFGNASAQFSNSKFGTTAIYPERVAEHIESAFSVFNEPGAFKTYVKALDKLTAYWKIVTLAHPSWFVGNMTSDLWLAQMAGARPDQIVTNAKDALAIVRARGRGQADRLVSVGGQMMRTEDILMELVERGVVGSNFYDEVAPNLVLNKVLRMSRNQPFRHPIQFWNDAMVEAAEASTHAAAVKDMGNGAKKAFQIGYALRKESQAMIGAWFKVNAQVADTMRTATYLSLRNQGMNADDAARRIVENMFDYQDLSTAETNLKRVFPFYVWLKNSMAQQTSYAMQHPWYATLAPKLKEAFEEMTVGDAQVPDQERPAWLREQLAIQIGADPESRWAFTVGSLVPPEQMYRALSATQGLEGTQDFLNFFMSSMNPVPRVVGEVALGREFFSDRTIGPSSTDAELSIAEHVLGQIRPLREIYNPASIRRGAVPAAFDRSFGEGVGRITLGGRIQPFNEDRIGFNNRREIQEAEQNIRRAIRISVREGSDHDGRTARLELLRLYDAALSLGFDDIVPKWAQRQLAEIKGVSDSAD